MIGQSAQGPRGRVLTLLQEAQAPLDAAQVATALGTHVTTARFHLNNLVSAGMATRAVEPSKSPGRPRVGYRASGLPAPAGLLSLLLDQLGSTEQAREFHAAEAGRVWAGQADIRRPVGLTVPDPVTTAADVLQQLGFKVVSASSILGEHELRICSCPLREIAVEHPEIARGVQRGAVEQALAMSSPALASQYAVAVQPDPVHGSCQVALRLSRVTRQAASPPPTSTRQALPKLN